MDKRRVLVMMSTYNGEKYLREQIDSIFGQKDVEVVLMVRDDGSTDHTLSILKEYMTQDGINLILTEGSNVGWKRSFHELIQRAAAMAADSSTQPGFDYYAFADQDDIWLPEKLHKGTATLDSMAGVPALYCCNQYYYKDGENRGVINGRIPTPTVKNCLVRNYATGCTIVFNRDLLERLGKGGIPEPVIAHDYWCYMAAVLCGSVYIDPEAYILYRQHDANQIGSKTSWSDNWKRRNKALRNNIGDHYREITAKELLRTLGPYMTEEGREAVEKLAGYRNSMAERLGLLKDSGYTLNNRSSDIWLKLRIILGRV